MTAFWNRSAREAWASSTRRKTSVWDGRWPSDFCLPRSPPNREALDRFQGEARAASSLNHANICTLLDVGGPEDQPFLVMELLEGHALSRRIAGKLLPPSECRCYSRHPGAGRHQPEKAAARHRAVKIRFRTSSLSPKHQLGSRLGKPAGRCGARCSRAVSEYFGSPRAQ